MTQSLKGVRVAILASDGFEESELSVPRAELDAAGIETHIIAPEHGHITAWAETEWGEKYHVDKTLDEVSADDYAALMLPGGVINPDTLRQNEKAQAFVRGFFKAGKPVGAICHAPWILINAGVVDGRRMTSIPSISKDLINAGAEWEDSEVVCDNALVTSRKPSDLDAFCSKLIEEIDEGRHSKQHA
ncbi:type 1 glutamine amidotransferase domain-containing protein [Larsenimonas suaedae]|uniref:Type 1 glutamine amidotransferase n=1 Tax=Larsenimonas suaedae TaxID=1851019 RepID=A0ABU1GWU7_9GAMM|nr:type 1 glutamine amidotransferase domain-containing protein [Larsenimonas suaedae]MCM2973091.1 type 1 glutamine amidotransferase [Larsenimonas suaedae]MDR5896528.1 type 1 glutamine amidotransferase [Larsenimonas suaedae]